MGKRVYSIKDKRLYAIPLFILFVGVIVGLAFLIKYIVDESKNNDSPVSSPVSAPISEQFGNFKEMILAISEKWKINMAPLSAPVSAPSSRENFGNDTFKEIISEFAADYTKCNKCLKEMKGWDIIKNGMVKSDQDCQDVKKILHSASEGMCENACNNTVFDSNITEKIAKSPECSKQQMNNYIQRIKKNMKMANNINKMKTKGRAPFTLQTKANIRSHLKKYKSKH